MRFIDAILIGTYDLDMHLWTMAAPWPMGYGGKPSNMEKLVERGRYMLVCLHVPHSQLMSHRFAEKFVTELDAFFAMKDCIASFDDEIPKLKKDPERLNNIGKLVSDHSDF